MSRPNYRQYKAKLQEMERQQQAASMPDTRRSFQTTSDPSAKRSLSPNQIPAISPKKTRVSSESLFSLDYRDYLLNKPAPPVNITERIMIQFKLGFMFC